MSGGELSNRKREVVSITVADPCEAWRAAGFSVDDSGVARIGSVELRCAGSGVGEGVVAWVLRGVNAEGVDGLVLAEASGAVGTGTGDEGAGDRDRPRPSAAGEHPNGALRIDHVVVMTPDIARTTEAFEAQGFDVRRVRDVDRGRPIRQVFFRAGEVIVEVVGPRPDGGEADPGTGGSGPARFFGLAITVADLDATAELLGPTLGEVKDAIQEGRRIATLRNRDVGMSTAVAFMTPDPSQDALGR